MKSRLPRFIALAAIAALVPLGASADPSTSPPLPLEAGIGLSTLGYTFTGAYRPGTRIFPSILLSSVSTSRSISSNGADYTGTLKNSAIGALANFDPGSEGGFIFSGGVVWTNYKFDGTASNVSIGGTRSTLSVDVQQKQHVAPMMQVSYRIGGPSRAHFDVSVGAILGKGFQIQGTDPTGTFSQSQIDQQLSSARADAKDATVIPYLKLGVSLNF